VIPPFIDNFVNLVELRVDNNELSTLPESIYNLKHLKILDISGNIEIKELPPGLSRISALEELVLSYTGITKLSDEYKRLNVKVLIYSNCKLSSVPSQIWELKSLRELDLSGNDIKSLPDDVANLSNMQKIVLSECGFNKMPSVIGKLPNLTYLDLNSSNLGDIGEFDFSQLKLLVELYMSDCKLTRIGSEIGECKQLRIIDFSRNRLKRIPRQIGWIGSSLRKLVLSDNDLDEVPGELCLLDTTLTLDLSNNKLQEPYLTWYTRGVPILLEELPPKLHAYGPLCETAGEHVTKAVKLTGVDFKIQAKDFKGKNRTTGGDSFEAAILPMQDQGVTVDVVVKDNKDGTYGVFYNCPKVGTYKLQVSSEGIAVKGSPFTLVVTESAPVL